MKEKANAFLRDNMGISADLLERVLQAEDSLTDSFAALDDIMAYNQYKVLDVFQKCRISDMHFGWNTG